METSVLIGAPATEIGGPVAMKVATPTGDILKINIWEEDRIGQVARMTIMGVREEAVPAPKEVAQVLQAGVIDAAPGINSHL